MELAGEKNEKISGSKALRKKNKKRALKNDNFTLDFEGSENSKKKFKKSCESLFTDVMQNTSHEEASSVSRKVKVVPCAADKKAFLRSEASENDMSDSVVELAGEKNEKISGSKALRKKNKKRALKNDTFKVDFEGSENRKKKFKKSESLFTDVMENTSHEELSVSRKVKVVPCATDKKAEASENDVSDFVKLPQKKLRGFDGREDTPERLSRTVFVGNLPLSFNRKLLQALFQNFGEIESVRLRSAVPARSSLPKKVAVIRKQFHKESSSFNGYVVLKNVEDVEKALTLNKVVVQGHHIRVDRFKASVTYDNKRSVFVGNLSYDVTTESLWSVFGECGSIEAVRIVRDPETGLGKGFGFILFEECDSVRKALLLNNAQVNGRNIRIKPVVKGNKLKQKTTVEGNPDTTSIKRKEKHLRTSWRSAGHKKSSKKLMRQKMGIKKKKRIAAILTQ